MRERTACRWFQSPHLDPNRRTHAIPLLGAFSNSETGDLVEKLNQLRKRILASAPSKQPIQSRTSRRIGEVQKAISSVLGRAGEPMHTTAIHRAVEKHLDRAVSYRTIKASLSRETQAKHPRYVRIAYGEYALARTASD
jgi:hypothetical protein